MSKREKERQSQIHGRLIHGWKCGKICYQTKAEADKAARALRRRKGERAYMATYLCNVCDSWHTTSRKMKL